MEETNDDIQNSLELKTCERERAEYLDGWQRAKADFANQSKAFEKERQIMRKTATLNLLSDLIKVIDSFNMAFANKEAWLRVDENWRIGVEHINTQLREILSSHGLLEIGKVGEVFDPNIHDSVETEEVEDASQDNIIVAVSQMGYKMGDRIIRPAKVKVSVFKGVININS